MKKDVLRVYIIELILLIVLSLALFVSNIFNRKILALVLLIFAIVTTYTIKTKKINSHYKKQVTWLMIGFAVIHIIIFYLMGLYFGYYESPTKFNLFTIWNFIIPLTIIVVSSEIIRGRLIVQKVKVSKIIVFIIMVLIDLIVYTGVYDINNFDDMLTIIGFILFASIACNLLYNYISVRFGSNGVIAYRLITVLFVYLIPYIPDVYLFFRSFLRMIYPYLIYLVLEYTYAKTNAVSTYRYRTQKVISTTIIMIIMILIIGLISCEFEFGILVIGSGSMSGSIDKGDAVVFRKYHNEALKEGQIIIFKNNDIQTVHRIIKVESVNGEYRYYTKGDANQQIDNDYRVKQEIVGVSKFKIKYIGYPTLWVRDIFEKDN